jgi:4-amino-4-deoxy-L-arabinose transferase-like glycosyltransferase
MFQRLHHRGGHYLLLLAVTAGLFLPHLGGPSLWDIDEGNNAEAAREMLESGNWVVPTFNFQLRPDKPALLYWLQIAAYQLFGVNEGAARIPSALAALLAVFVTYELGRRLYGATAGLLAGLILASTLSFCVSAHFANPDALLNLFTVLALFSFWTGHARGGGLWFVPFGFFTGLAMLAKGPVGLVLPLATIVLFLHWSRQLRRLRSWGVIWAALTFGLVIAPWYTRVGIETKADFLRGFFWTHNVGRFLSPLEHHSGPPYYYAAILLLGFAPWSAFLGLTLWSAVRELRAARSGSETDRRNDAAKFLLSWIAVYFLFFSCSRTKLPNYILPLFPALALLTARFLNQWRRGECAPPLWTLRVSLGCLALVGLVAGAGLLLAGGGIPLPALRGRILPGVASGVGLGIVLGGGALAAWWCLDRQWRTGLVAVCAGSAILFLGGLGAWGAEALNTYKAPRPLVNAFHVEQTEREIRVACYQYFQPSLVFYCQREVRHLEQEIEVLEFLRCRLPVYLFMPASVWETMEPTIHGPHRVLGRQRDLYRNCEVVVVTNR